MKFRMPVFGVEDQRSFAVTSMLCWQTSAVSSTMFLTANHPNPLTAQLVTDLGGQKISWTLWALAASVPGLISLLLIPLLLWTLQVMTILSKNLSSLSTQGTSGSSGSSCVVCRAHA